MKKRLHAIVFGRVQGVGYRYFVLQLAEELGIFGFVRNSGDETVEIEVEGEEQKLKDFLEKLKTGHSFARVEKIHSEWAAAKKEFSSFEIRH